MSARLGKVLETLAADGALPAGWREELATLPGFEAELRPWYVRALVGFGAWLASLFFLGFVFTTLNIFDNEVAIMIFGALLTAGAWVLRSRSRSDFNVQLALASALAGEAMFVIGLWETAQLDYRSGLAVIVMLQGVLAVVFPDTVHRFLSVLFSAGAGLMLIYALDGAPFIHVYVLALGVAVVALQRHDARLRATGLSGRLRPIAYGLLVAWFGYLLMSAVYVLPMEWREEVRFYPRPWLSSIGLGALWLWVAWRLMAEGRLALPGTARVLFLGGIVLIVVCALKAPGLIGALLVVMLGAAYAERLLLGAGFAFLTVFLGAYFYGIEISLLAKSGTLILTGLVLFGLRFLLHLSARSGEGGHA